MKENTNVSIQILVLNDLLRTNTIDKDIYDRAIAIIKDIKTDIPAA